MPARPTNITQLPNSMPVFPLSGALLLPQTNRPLKIFEPRFIEMIDTIFYTKVMRKGQQKKTLKNFIYAALDLQYL